MRTQGIFEPLLSIPGKTCPFYLAMLNNWVLQTQKQLQETQEDKLDLTLEMLNAFPKVFIGPM